jgi:hypothetical protein
VIYVIECEQDESPVKGNFASGDDEQDRADEETILSRLDRGDIWAWCCVRVKAIADDGSEAYSSWLGGCCYADETDFRAGPYFEDLCVEASDELLTVRPSNSQTIQTKKSGTRVRVTAQPGTKIYPWDHALNAEKNHAAAARKYAADLGWTGKWVGGLMPDGKSYVFVDSE